MKKDKKSAPPEAPPGLGPSSSEPDSNVVDKSVDFRDEETQHGGANDDTVAKPPQPETTPPVPVAPTPQSRQNRFPVISGYRIDEVIGRGGMGVVYRAQDLKLGRTVAIKTLLLANHGKDFRQRIENEARLLAKVQHPGVVQIFEFGFADDPENMEPLPFIAMEFVDGENLDKFNNRNPLKPKQAATLVYKLAKTLSACHQRGIIHRDLKPANVLMASDAEPKLTDFGLARIAGSDSRMTRSGEVMGTPGFMAPEQASGAVKNLGPSVDIYGLGALLYELLTGRPPFMAPDPMQTLIQVLTQPPVPPSSLQTKLPRDIETITLKCLEKKPRHRYESCDELASDLRAFLSNKPISAKRTPALRKAKMWVRRHPAVSSLIGLAIAATFAGILGTAFHVNSLQTELDRSQRIINEGRSLSKWLLDDFRDIIEGTGGVTYARSELAARTQTYLDALLREAADDEVLKTDLAYAYNRLASIQEEIDARGADRTELAVENNARAEVLVNSLKDPDSELAQKVLAAVSLQRASVLIESGKFPEARELLAQVENQVGDANSIKAIDRLNFKCGIEFERFQIFLAEGDSQAAEASLQRISELKDEIVEDGTRTDMTIISIVNLVGASELFLEPNKEFDELFYILDTARMELTKIGSANPLIDMDVYLCTIETKMGNTYFRTEEYEKALTKYQSAMERHVRIHLRDSKNLVAQYNLALAWQNIGDTHMAMANYDEANKAYDSAATFFEKWNKQQGGQLDRQLAWLMFLGNRADLYGRTGEIDLARETINQQLAGLNAIPDRSVFVRRSIGDALLSAAMIEALSTGNVDEDDTGKLEEAFNNAKKAFEKAKAQFDLMETDGIGSEATRNQSRIAGEMIKHIKEQIDKINKILPENDL